VSGLEPFRERLDALDDQIVALLGERFEVCREIAAYKQQHDVPMMQPTRVKEVRERYEERAAGAELPADFIASFFAVLIAATCRMEDELIAAAAGGDSA
jgi:4-amino-4-deoxychorismate mutase